MGRRPRRRHPAEADRRAARVRSAEAKIFVALLGKQYGVTPPGWREAAGDHGREGCRRSVADITGPESPAQVRQFEQETTRAEKAVVTS